MRKRFFLFIALVTGNYTLSSMELEQSNTSAEDVIKQFQIKNVISFSEERVLRFRRSFFYGELAEHLMDGDIQYVKMVLKDAGLDKKLSEDELSDLIAKAMSKEAYDAVESLITFASKCLSSYYNSQWPGFYNTLLLSAVIHKQYKLIDLLIERKKKKKKTHFSLDDAKKFSWWYDYKFTILDCMFAANYEYDVLIKYYPQLAHVAKNDFVLLHNGAQGAVREQRLDLLHVYSNLFDKFGRLYVVPIMFLWAIEYDCFSVIDFLLKEYYQNRSIPFNIIEQVVEKKSALIDVLLKHGIDSLGPLEYTILDKVVEHYTGDELSEIIQKLQKAGVSFSQQKRAPALFDLLYNAIKKNDIDCVHSLLEGRIDLTTIGPKALALAIKHHRVDIVQQLLRHNVDVSVRVYISRNVVLHPDVECVRENPFHSALLHKNPVMIRLLFNAGARYSGCCQWLLSTILTSVPESGKALTLAGLYAYSGAMDTLYNNSFQYQLAVQGDVDRLRMSLDYLVHSINQQDELGATLLMYAAAQSHVEVVKMLLERGADLTIKNRYGHTIVDILKVILEGDLLPTQRRRYKTILGLCTQKIIVSEQCPLFLHQLPRALLGLTLSYVAGSQIPLLGDNHKGVPIPSHPHNNIPAYYQARHDAAGDSIIDIDFKMDTPLSKQHWMQQWKWPALITTAVAGLGYYWYKQRAAVLKADELFDKLMIMLEGGEYVNALAIALQNQPACHGLTAAQRAELEHLLYGAEQALARLGLDGMANVQIRQSLEACLELFELLQPI